MTKKKKLLCFILITLVLPVSLFNNVINTHPVNASGESWLDGWGYRKSKLIDVDSVNNGAGFTVTGGTVPLNLHTGSGSDDADDLYFNGKCLPYFDDIRVTEDDGGTGLDYYLKDLEATTAELWVEVNATDTSDITIYIYYGNPSAEPASSGTDTCLWFDDFKEAGGTDQYTQIASTVRLAPWTWDETNNPILEERSDALTELAGDLTTTPAGNEAVDRIFFSKWTASASGTATHIAVATNNAGYVKVGLYSDSGGEPSTRLAKQDTAYYCGNDQTNYIPLESSYAITASTVYWIGTIADTAGTVQYKAGAGDDGRYKAATFSTYTFPSSAGSGYSTTTNPRLAMAIYTDSGNNFPNWESLGLYGVSLMVDTDGNLVEENGKYILYYTGYYPDLSVGGFVRAIGRATIDSTDNVTVTRDSNNPILVRGSNAIDSWGVQEPCVIKRGTGDYIMFYCAEGDPYTTEWVFSYATSTDGISWTKSNTELLSNDDFNLEASNPKLHAFKVIKLSNGTWFMACAGVYDADEIGEYWQIYGATAANGDEDGTGSGWSVLNSGDAIFEPAGGGAWDDDTVEFANGQIVEITDGTVVLLYVSTDLSNRAAAREDWGDLQYRGGAAYASISDLTSWTRYTENPIMTVGSYNDWLDGAITGILIAKDDIGTDTIRCWFMAHPYQDYGGSGNLPVPQGKIGFATCDQTAIKYDYTDKWTKVGTQEVSYVSYDDAPYCLRLQGDAAHTNSLINSSGTYDNFVIEIHFKPTIDDKTHSIPYVNTRYTDMNNRYLTMLRPNTNNDIFIRRVESGSTYLDDSDAYDYSAQWYWFKQSMNSTAIKTWIDNVLQNDVTDTGSGITGAGSIGIQNYQTYRSVLFDVVAVRKYSSSEPQWSTTGSEEEEGVSISIDISTWNIGELIASETANTGLDYFTVTNDGDVTIDITISGVDMTGTGVTWTLSDTATAGDATYGLKAGLSGGSYNIVVKKTATYNFLVEDLVASGTQDFGLEIYAPTTNIGQVAMSGTITLTASLAA